MNNYVFINELQVLIESQEDEFKSRLKQANRGIMARVSYAMCSTEGLGRHLVEYLNADDIYRLLCCQKGSYIENKLSAVATSQASAMRNREKVLASFKRDGYAHYRLKYASAELKNDREVVLAAVKQSGYPL